MFIRTALLVIGVFAASGCHKQQAASPAEETQKNTPDPVVSVSEDDQAMNDAINNARSTVDVFVNELKAIKPNYTYSVKKLFDDGNEREHMWLTDVSYDGQLFTGRLDNTPEFVKNAKEGQKYSVGRDEISDWMYVDPQKRIHGGYTMRVLLPQLSDDERQQLEMMLAPLPTAK